MTDGTSGAGRLKVRIGFAAGAGVADDPAGFLRLIDALGDLGYDSVWVPDVVTTATMEPLAALGVAAGRRPRLKFGTHLILPGRNPVILAKQLATLDQLSEGRVLLNGVLGLRAAGRAPGPGGRGRGPDVDAGGVPARHAHPVVG